MIGRCQCGAIKTVPPYMNAMEVRWVCSDECGTDKRTRELPKVEVEYTKTNRKFNRNEKTKR
jgi:hypothetical protein